MLSAAGPAAAQVLIRGVVTDAQTGAGLAGATVQVEGTALGAVTNAEGRFELAVGRYPVRLLVRHIGYGSRKVELDRPPGAPLVIELEPEVIGLGGLVVTDGNVAEGIMRRALDRKAAWQDSIGTAYAEAYSRFLLMREFEAVRVEETISGIWWKAGRGTREIVRARRTSPRREEAFRFAGPLPIPNLYDDTIEYAGTRFTGPLHPDALATYRFSLTDRRVLDGREVFDIAFVPESATSAAFTGSVSVEDSTFDALLIRVRPAVDRAGPPPVIERVVRMEQAFTRVSGAMRPVSFRAEGHVRFGMTGLSYPTARFRQVAGLTLHAVNVPVPDTLFSSDTIRRDAPDASLSAWLFDWNPGWVPPTADEAMALSRIAAAPPLAAAFRPDGLFRGYLAVDVTDDAAGADPGDRRIEWLRPWAWYNRVDGWQVGLQPLLPLGESWSVTPRLGYAEARQGVPWGIELARDPPEGLIVGLGADEVSAVVGEDIQYSRFMLGLAAYGGWTDHHDYYARRRAYASAGWTADPGRASVTLSVERHRSERRHDDYEGFFRRNALRPNPPIDEGRLVGLTLDLSTGDARMPGYHRAAYAGSSILVARRGVLGSDFGFIRWTGAFAVRFPTFLEQRRRPASLRLDLYFGLTDDRTPVQLEGFLQLPVGPLAPGAGFRVSDARLPLVRHWIAAFWQHDFGALFGGLPGMAESGLGFGLFGGHAVSADESNGGHHELGVFVSDLLGYPVRLNLGSSLERIRLGMTVSVTQTF
jgi:hypothetical protein